ncbi:hypothetical protein [Angustibacter sp. Root456]|uniref:hypothetical protein n=1 Tax=Angustibacter sp. Root456 TaxID=1736539 RepID=UPI0006FA521E|nr:hypothetical protein [Angustibacter sp. Root456]KQX65791.1 hypothetical protein ASD06_09300 [Angustibacter sp. Root456]
MSDCSDLAPALEQLRADFMCRPVPGTDRLLVSTGRYLADGSGVDLLVRFTNDGQVIVSDGGLVSARVELAELNLDSGSVSDFWRSIVEDFGVSEISGRIFARGPVDRAASLIGQVADAAVALDMVRHIAPPAKSEPFQEQVRRWLIEDAQVEVTDQRTVHTITGAEEPVTAVVRAPGRDVAIMSAVGRTTSDRRRGTEHAFYVFSQLPPSVWQPQARLTILGGQAARWKPEQIAALRGVSYVGSIEQPVRLATLLKSAEWPADHNLMTLGSPLPPFESAGRSDGGQPVDDPWARDGFNDDPPF